MVLPALVFAEQDRQCGVPGTSAACELAAHFTEWWRMIVEPLDDRAAGAERGSVDAGPRVLCVGTRDGLDDVAATMLVSCCGKRASPPRPPMPASLLHGGRPRSHWDLSACPSRCGLPAICAPAAAATARPAWPRIPACICLWGRSARRGCNRASTKTQRRGWCRQPRQAYQDRELVESELRPLPRSRQRGSELVLVCRSRGAA